MIWLGIHALDIPQSQGLYWVPSGAQIWLPGAPFEHVHATL
jgi:hypothetical protein